MIENQLPTQRDQFSIPAVSNASYQHGHTYVSKPDLPTLWNPVVIGDHLLLSDSLRILSISPFLLYNDTSFFA